MAAPLGTRTLVFATVLALTASSAFAITSPASANSVASDPAPVTIGPKPENDGPKQQVPAFNVSTQQRIHGRAGGTGLVDVHLSRRMGAGVLAKDLSVRISGPAGFRVTSAAEFTPPCTEPTTKRWTGHAFQRRTTTSNCAPTRATTVNWHPAQSRRRFGHASQSPTR